MFQPTGPFSGQLARACSTCGVAHTRKHYYCAPCHAANMREWRKTNPLNPEQRRKDNCRSLTKYRVQTGKLVKAPCAVANCAGKVEAHHPDYGNPDLVVWVCRDHHLAHHRGEIDVNPPS